MARKSNLLSSALRTSRCMRGAFCILTMTWTVVTTSVSAAADPAHVSYSQAHAVFAKHCIACHDAKEAEGEFVLESWDLLMKGGEKGADIVPGKPDESRLIRQIEHKAKPFMPPKKAHDTLGTEEIATVRAWILGGAHNAAPGEVVPTTAPTIVIPKIEARVVPRKPVRAIAWSAPAKLAAVARDEQIELINVEEREVVRRLHVDRGTVNTVAFAADGKTLAAGAGEPNVAGEIDVWNIADGSRTQRFEGHHDAVYSIAIAPNGKTLASGSYDNGIILWDLSSGKPIRSFDGHNGAILGLAFRPDGNVLASASADRTVKLWDVQSGARLDTFAESLKDLNAVLFTSDGQRLIAAGGDNRIREWQISPTAKEGTNHLLVAQFGHEGAILGLALSTDGKLLASSADDRTVKLWDPTPISASGSPELKMMRVLPAQADWPVAISFGADQKLLLIGRLDGSLGYFDPQNGNEILPPKPQIERVSPPGIQRGTTSRIELSGKHLSGISGFWFSKPKISARLVSSDASGTAVVEITSPADVPLSTVEMKVSTAGGESGASRLFVDDLPQALEQEPNDSPATARRISLPTDVWGKFDKPGDADHFSFDGKSGQTIVFDVASQRLESKAKVLFELLDGNGQLLASSSSFDGTPEPLLSFALRADGKYTVRLTELEAAASADHFYRLSIGSFAFVTGCFPLAVAPNSESKVQLVGLNLPADASTLIKSEAAGEMDFPLEAGRYRSRQPIKLLIGPGPEPVESEPNDTPERANPISVPGVANGRIDHPGDQDLFRFDAVAGRNYTIETLAARRGSPIDTRIEVLHADGSLVPRVILRAVRDSAITFRGFDANAQGGRLQNWEEMDLRQYLYLSGEVVRLMLAPRGPDSEYGFFTVRGKRQCYFDTTATAHSLDERCFIVEPHPPGETFSPNGLPVFTIDYVNDDGADRTIGSDSRLLFTAPTSAPYLVRVTDARNWGGDRFAYRLTVRPAVPDFNVSMNLPNPSVAKGAGRNFQMEVDRIDGFDGPVRVEISGAPPGFIISTPIVIEAGHAAAQGTIYALSDAPAPTPANELLTKLTITATVDGKEIAKAASGFGKISLSPGPMLTVGLDPIGATTQPAADLSSLAEITVVPGQFTPAHLWIHRNNFKDEATFEADNLPHGVIIADIGLSGVSIPEGQSERQIFLHTAPWVAEQDRLCYVRALQAGTPTSKPVMIHVRKVAQQAAR